MEGNELRLLFGRNVRIFRNRRKWSQSDLAESANISLNFLGDIERGRKWPHPDTLSNLANALEINVFELFLEDHKPVTPEKKDNINQFLRDLSLAVNKSMSSSINQAIEYISKQYNLRS